MNLNRAKGWTVIAALVSLSFLPSAATGATYVVRASGNDWKPKLRKIVKRDVVKWRNPTKKRHDVRSIGSKWSYSVVLDPGESARKRFKKAGRFPYRCTLHSGIVDGKCQGMCGVVVVKRP